MQITSEHINLFLQKCKKANWAGVFYSSPFENHFQFLLQDLNQIQTASSDGFIFHPFNEQETPRVVLHHQYKNEEALELLNQSITLEKYWTLPVLQTLETTSREDYQIQFEKYISAIQSGYCNKAILSTVIKSEIPSSFNTGEFIFRLRREYPQAFIYIFSSPITGTWLGATPETFLKWKDGEISTVSLAGTKRKSETSFSFGNKEKEEQEIVTQYIHRIFDHHFGKTDIEDPVEYIYGEMVHLITKMKAALPAAFNQSDFIEIARAFHPTPAVGGYPKKEAIALIHQTENHSRLYYSGHLGPINQTSAELVVNLRCMALGNHHGYIYAGGGLTKDSQLDSEWAETRLKADALLRYMGQ